LVAAKFETERRYAERAPDALTTWILLDDFEHWFGGGKFPDLLFVAIDRGPGGVLQLHAEVLEAKCVSEGSFAVESSDAQEQVRRGLSRLGRAFAAGAEHLDALYWYDQLHRAVTGNLRLSIEQEPLWELFRERLVQGAFELQISGHTWAFCYDGRAGLRGVEERPFERLAPDMEEAPQIAHHLGRNELCQLLRALIEEREATPTSDAMWAQPAEPAPQPVVETPSPRHAEPLPQTQPLRPITKPLPQTQPLRPAVEELPPEVLARDEGERRWLEQKARDLEHALRRRGVQLSKINMSDADVGPSIVRFKLRLSGNETIRKLQAAAVDLARDLSLTNTPFIDNVLGTNFVGIDLPRARSEVVDLLPLLQGLTRAGPGELPIIIGKTPDGRLHIDDLAEFPHLLVAGATGSGKSVFLRSVLLGLMTQYAPRQVELLIVDPKQTDFSFFDESPYLRGGKVFAQAAEARDALLELVRSEMPRRQQLMRGRSLKIKDFNKRFPAEALPPIVAMIDEYAQLLSIMAKKEAESFERDLMSLAAVARSTGIHLILATQRPSVNVVTGTLKANLPTRIAFQVPTNNDSRVVLDVGGAENLIGRGDMLLRRTTGEVVRLQAPFMDEEAMQAYLAELNSRS
jgi:DNA segregation ATPase FtsK/SpoIIIE-like protein